MELAAYFGETVFVLLLFASHFGHLMLLFYLLQHSFGHPKINSPLACGGYVKVYNNLYIILLSQILPDWDVM